MPTYNGFNTAMLRTTVVAGDAAKADLTVAGLALDDQLVQVLFQDGDQIVQANLVSEASITAAGTMQLSTTDTTGGRLVILWLDVSAAEV